MVNYCPGCGAFLGAWTTTRPAAGDSPMVPVPLRAPGWHPDPFGRLPYRWWDGSQWSSYAAGADVQWDPSPLREVAPRTPGLRAMGVGLIGFATGVALSLLSLVVMRWAGRPGGRPVELLVSELGLWAGLVAACVFVTKRRGTGSLARDFGLGIRPIDLGLGLAGSFAARVGSSVAILPVVVAYPHLRAPDQSVFQKIAIGPAGWVILALVVCVGAPVVEELFFRGLIQTRLIGRWGPVLGIGATSILFGSAHLIGWQGPISLVYALAIVGAGAVLGTMRHLTGRLGTSMASHCFFNAQALIALAFLSS